MRTKAQVLRDFRRVMAGCIHDELGGDYSDRVFGFMGELRVGEARLIWNTMSSAQRRRALSQIGGDTEEMTQGEILVEAVTWHLTMTAMP